MTSWRDNREEFSKIKMCIYKITNKVNGKSYIGQTINPVYKRWVSHTSRRKANLNTAIGGALHKYGENDFVFTVLDIAETQEQLDHKEKFWISALNTIAPFGYNLGLGGNGKGKCSLETRQKISAVQRGRKQSKETIAKRAQSCVGRVGYWAGKKQPAELVLRRSEKLKGRKLSEEHKKILLECNKNRVFSQETRRKMSETRLGRVSPMKGKKLSEERCKQISAMKTGTVHSAATKAKMSLAQTGRRHSQETKDKLSKDRSGVARKTEDVITMSRSKMKGMCVVCETGERFLSYYEAGVAMGIKRTVIWNCVKGVQKTANGLKFWLEVLQ